VPNELIVSTANATPDKLFSYSRRLATVAGEFMVR
jgi:hypothetical protein